MVISICRDLDRERSKLEQQEKKVIADIKKMAKAGQMVCQSQIQITVRHLSTYNPGKFFHRIKYHLHYAEQIAAKIFRFG